MEASCFLPVAYRLFRYLPGIAASPTVEFFRPTVYFILICYYDVRNLDCSVFCPQS